MNAKEFLQLCQTSGYAKKTDILEYINQNPKDTYDTSDVENVYRKNKVTHKSPLATGYIPNGRKTTSSGYRS